ncbi:MAG: YebC/PmpR family DNA-binding transcriptional regulator [Candidatus Vogelbacteria bacterium CG10_big_fil_rev_8_21_14_0_10_45_14]|uniref:YebC/PmpR family DNA-binding transcriptional regulator n=1 Tax=Candidatus Vogelbacteria bacterium CG10_big_fil_rev_8_21_14_0_10_45_14 TaxID=1975042 RepID=A0A2H0RID3_9BACT|nr:MAG: YebC/PmpR family DNA-binding transcriptional regulator [Candidatus Vogelbacteria bacterium CG10_big_fil_rev_8_21_14_0_10_45_14]
MSGHSKWAKLKHTKGVADLQKSKLISMHSRVIATAVREAGGEASSSSVRSAIDRARKDNVTNENIDRAIKRGQGAGGEAFHEVVFEGFGNGGVAILIVAMTDNNNRTSQEIKHIFTKHNLSLGAPGSASWAFTKTENGYSPTTPIELSGEDSEKLSSLVSAIEEHDDVQDVYTTSL